MKKQTKKAAEVLEIKRALKKKPATKKKKKAWKNDEERNAFLAKARDAYFKENGLGPYKPKSDVSAAKSIAKKKKDAPAVIAATVVEQNEAIELLTQLGVLLGLEVKKRA